MELRVMFEELMPRIASIELTRPDKRETVPSTLIGGLKSLPVRMEMT
jgi:hypothetical protein